MKTTPTIIVKARKQEHAPHHGGAWKVAYADFVTALMAFFLVMWLVGQDSKTRHAIGEYFRDPGAFAEGKGASLLEGGGGVHPSDGSAPAPLTPSIQQDRRTLEQAAAQIQEALQGTPEFAQIRGQVEVRMTSEGLRIEMQESASACFFDTGSATMTPQAERLFATIGQELQKLPNGILIEGHTDSRQYANRAGYTNWELSADRANAVRRVMETAGLREQQLFEVRGYADKQLRNTADPLDARNRRVSILVRHVEQNGAITPEPPGGARQPTP